MKCERDIDMNKKVAEYWNAISRAYYEENDTPDILAKIIDNPACAFPTRSFELIQTHIGDFKGKSVCIPSSGDNTAVFAFHLLGAKVTSTDISAEQLKNAQAIAEKKGWDIEFVLEDSLDFGKISSGAYDLVYTSNGVGVWISDLERMYRNFHRVLKDNGYYIMFETHPFIRPFDDSQDTITVVKRYDDLGPSDGVPEYAWRVEDFLNSVIAAGFTVKAVQELHSEVGSLSNHNWWYKSGELAEQDQQRKHDWRQNPWAALPQWFSMCVQKENHASI
jgi:SAM-dependent methyltransferase